jgi:hypothetical protein
METHLAPHDGQACSPDIDPISAWAQRRGASHPHYDRPVRIANAGVVGLVVGTAFVLATPGRAWARPQVTVYKGKLAHAGRIRVEIRGARVTVHFVVDCKGEELGTGEGQVNYEPPSGRLRGGRLSLDSSEPGETTNETSSAPEARIRLQARLQAHKVTGVLSVTQRAGASLFPGDAGTGTPACSTGPLQFVAR